MNPELGNNKKIGVGERIRWVRGTDSIPSFAEKMGVHKSTLIRYEKEESYPDAKIILNFCELFDINPNWLLTGEGPKKKYPPPGGFSWAMNKLRERVHELRRNPMTRYYLSHNEKLRNITIQNLTQFSQAEFFPSDDELQGLCEIAGFDYDLVKGERSPEFAYGNRQLVEGITKTITNITDSHLMGEVIEVVEKISLKNDIALPVAKKAEMIAILYDEIAVDSSKKESLQDRANRLFKLAL